MVFQAIISILKLFLEMAKVENKSEQALQGLSPAVWIFDI